MLQPATSRTATQAGTHLGLAPVARAHDGLIGFDVHDLAIFDMALPHAAATAVHCAVRVDNLFLGIRESGLRGAEHVGTYRSYSTESSQGAQSGRHLSKCATIHVELV